VDVPKGAVCVVQVVLFEDGSVNVAAPPFGGSIDTGTVAATLVGALDVVGYDAEASRRADAVPMELDGLGDVWVPAAGSLPS
jgi:hypothetical protein